MMTRLTARAALTAALGILTGCADEPRYPGPRSPEAAASGFQISDKFEVEIFAAEPYVADPVSMAFDESGRAFVVEMHDYPDPPPEGQGRSRIRMLEDTDWDGRVDTSYVFAEGLSEATSVLPWKGGLLVTAAPDILYLKDTDGDRRADQKEVLFTGFFTGNSEAQITNLRYGVDNWIYAANTGNPGEITYTGRPDAPPLSVRGADFRFRLDRGEFGRATGYAQFGQDFDDFGHRFVTQNTIHVRNIVLPEPYLSRNPYLPSPVGRAEISDHDLTMYQLTPPPYWRAVRTERRNEKYQASGLDRVEYAEDHFTGSSGGTVYAGDTFGEGYYGNLFTGDVAGNLVHRDVLRPEGATFVASRAPEEQDREFLASEDPWFRPASLAVGPDGNLYVVDMYRQHIETPLSIPEDLKADMDFYAGSDMGRIYRIVPKGAERRAERPNLRQASTQELVGSLAHPNRWWRLTAQRLVVERQDRSAVPHLQRLLESETPQTRLHALYAMEGLGALDADIVGRMLGDEHPGVREHAIRLAEHYPSLLPHIVRAVDDPSPRVAFQAALSLGEFEGANVRDALASVAAERGGDEWFRKAVLSSEVGSSVEMLEALARRGFFDEETKGKRAFVAGLSAVIGTRNEGDEVARLLSAHTGTGQEAWQLAGLRGLAEGAERTESPRLSARAEEQLRQLQASASAEVQEAARAVVANMNEAAKRDTMKEQT